MRYGRHTRVTLAIAVATGTMGLGAPAAARAQGVSVPAAQVFAPHAPEPAATPPQPNLTLSSAVTLTLQHNPTIAREATALQAASGRARESRGLFDATFRSGASIDVTRQQILPFQRAREVSKRETIQIITNEFATLTSSLRGLIAHTSTRPPRCPTGLSFDTGSLHLDRLDPAETALLGVNQDISSPVLINLGNDITSVDLSNICGTQVDPLISPEAFTDLWRRIDQSGGLGLNGVLTSVSQIPRETRILEAQVMQAVALRGQLALDRLGPVPQDDIQQNVTLDTGLTKLLHNGVTFDGSYQIQSQEHNFVDKPLDPTFGGFDVPPGFYSTVSATLTMPLGRGRGATATAAPAEAATRLATAEAEQLRHTVNEAVFQTTLSYINLLAAQETVQLLDASVARHQQLVTLTRARVNGGDFAPLELDRVQARAASTEAAAAQARTSLREARLALADTVGLGVTSLTAAPTAVGTLATTVAPAGRIAELQQQAATSRHDLRALDEQQEAARVLAAGARANARTRIDLSVSAGYSNLYESPFFKYLPDEAASIIDQTQPVPIASLTGTPVPPQSPVHYYSARGFGRALTGRHEPFAMIGLTVELPFGNHAAKGRAAQAEATLQSSTISAADLVRTTDLNVADVTDALRHATDSVAAWTSTTAASTEALTGTMQRFQSGDATLIDTLLTEESLTNDELMLIEQRQVQLSVLARLRYETGTLVTFDGAGTPGELIRFLPDDFVAP